MANLISPVQILGFTVPEVHRELPVPGPIQTYTILYSQLFELPPSNQGKAGDLFVSRSTIFYKTQNKRWVVAHFNREVDHPSINTLHLSYDDSGPCWARHPQSPHSFEQEQPLHIARQFYEAIAYYRTPQLQGPGSNADQPIEVDSE